MFSCGWRPYGGLVAGRLLEHDVDGSPGSGASIADVLLPDSGHGQPDIEDALRIGCARFLRAPAVRLRAC
jgi:hypothetical protein